MTDYQSAYFSIAIFIVVAIVLSALITALPYFLAKFNSNTPKLAPYECGFDPFGDAHSRFDIKFYLVAILFVIFDLEIAFIIPWSVVLTEIGSFGFVSMIVFLLTILVGFAYEWSLGALEWE